MRHIIAILAAMILLVGAILWGAPAAGIEGTWLGKAEVPNSGIDELTMVLTKTEKGYTGITSDSVGLLAKDTPLSDIKLEGDKLTFKFPLADGAMISATLKVEGDKMTGGWGHEAGDVGSLAFERKK
ncbi:MAG: hypothetical protein NTZ26_01835 [Candidatus Aminicenantes bacterium]|nr:hypothetical protein [Candidatus Aminicenantes bacterium]